MKTYFITGTGTNAGKTFYTVKRTLQLRSQHQNILTLKPMISGFNPDSIAGSDTGLLLQAQGLALSQQNIDKISPWRFIQPISPDMAAEEESLSVSLEEVVAFCRSHTEYDVLLIEGAGGIMSPMGENFTNLDVIAHIGCEAILVGGTYLGAISHILTAVNALSSRNIALHTLVINESDAKPVSTKRIVLTLKRFLPTTVSIEILARQNND